MKQLPRHALRDTNTASFNYHRQAGAYRAREIWRAIKIATVNRNAI